MMTSKLVEVWVPITEGEQKSKQAAIDDRPKLMSSLVITQLTFVVTLFNEGKSFRYALIFNKKAERKTH